MIGLGSDKNIYYILFHENVEFCPIMFNTNKYLFVESTNEIQEGNEAERGWGKNTFINEWWLLQANDLNEYYYHFSNTNTNITNIVPKVLKHNLMNSFQKNTIGDGGSTAL